MPPLPWDKAKWLLAQLKPIAGKPIAEIEAAELFVVLKRLEGQRKHETAKRCRSFAGRVFRYAVVIGRAKADPAAMLSGALIAPKVKHHAAILDPAKLGELLRAIDDYEGAPITRLGSGFVGQSQKMTVAARAMAEKKAVGHRS